MRTHINTHSKSGSCNEIPFISGGICPWVQGLSGHCETFQIFGNTPDRASLIVSIRRAAGKKKTVGWIGGHAGTSNRKNKTTHQPSCCSQPPPMYTSLSCTNTMPLGTVMFSRSYYSDYSSGHKRHTDTHCLFKLYSPIRHEIKTRFHQSRSTLVS